MIHTHTLSLFYFSSLFSFPFLSFQFFPCCSPDNYLLFTTFIIYFIISFIHICTLCSFLFLVTFFLSFFLSSPLSICLHCTNWYPKNKNIQICITTTITTILKLICYFVFSSSSFLFFFFPTNLMRLSRAWSEYFDVVHSVLLIIPLLNEWILLCWADYSSMDSFPLQ